MSDLVTKGTAAMASLYQRFLNSMGDRLTGCSLELSPAGAGWFFARVSRESTFEDATVELTFEGQALRIDVASREQLGALTGLEPVLPADGAWALTFAFRRKEPGREDTMTRYEYSYTVNCSATALKFVSVDGGEVKAELELLLREETGNYGSIRGYELDESVDVELNEVPKDLRVTLEATCAFSEVERVFEADFKTRAPLRDFPVEKLSIDALDPLGLGAPPTELELRFREFALDGQTMRPNFLIDEPFGLGVETIADLEGKQYLFDKKDTAAPHGRVFNLYPQGSPYACLTRIAFGRVEGGSIPCTLEIDLELADIASHNPDHRYNDATCRLETRISVTDGFLPRS